MKKEYKKPQVVEVKLVVQNPILGLCDLNAGIVETGDCGLGFACANS